jgi:hypothetical protein
MLLPAQNSPFRRDSNGHLDNQLADHIGGYTRTGANRR